MIIEFMYIVKILFDDQIFTIYMLNSERHISYFKNHILKGHLSIDRSESMSLNVISAFISLWYKPHCNRKHVRRIEMHLLAKFLVTFE